MSTSDSEAAAPAASSALPRVLKAAGAVIAPGTALTGVLYYFGYLHAYWFCHYFGVHSTVLGFTFEDYLMRNVDGLFVPLTVVAMLGLLALWNHRLLGPNLARARSRITPGAFVAGVVLSILGLLNVFDVVALGLAVAPLSLAAGVLLLMVAVRTHRSGRPAPSWSPSGPASSSS